MIPNPDDNAKSDQEIKKTDHDNELPLDIKLLEVLRNLRSRAGIRVSMVIGYDGAILGIHEDAAYVPKVLRKGPHARSSKIDTNYFGKWSTSIHRTIEFVSESLFENGVKFILLEGTDQTKAIIVNMRQEINKGKSFLLVGILPIKGTIGLAYQEMKDSADRIAKILQENNSCQ
jgi:predicted regulator of Ras-like GTPase activity (Roadblock/LC7/MglB family)